jgi:hypothetical protein
VAEYFDELVCGFGESLDGGLPFGFGSAPMLLRGPAPFKAPPDSQPRSYRPVTVL